LLTYLLVVPVAWIYLDAWASADGTVHYRPDVYGLDSTGAGIKRGGRRDVAEASNRNRDALINTASDACLALQQSLRNQRELAGQLDQ